MIAAVRVLVAWNCPGRLAAEWRPVVSLQQLRYDTELLLKCDDRCRKGRYVGCQWSASDYLLSFVTADGTIAKAWGAIRRADALGSPILFIRR